MNRQQINDGLKELYQFNKKESGSIQVDELTEELNDSDNYILDDFDDYRDDEAAFVVYELKNKLTGEKAFFQFQGEWNSWDSNYYDDNELSKIESLFEPDTAGYMSVMDFSKKIGIEFRGAHKNISFYNLPKIVLKGKAYIPAQLCDIICQRMKQTCSARVDWVYAKESLCNALNPVA